MPDLILKDFELPLQELPNQESQSVVGGLALKTVSTDGLALKTVSTDGL